MATLSQDTFIVVFNDHYDQLANILSNHKTFLEKNWQRTFKITGMQNHFAEIFHYAPRNLANFTQQIANIYNHASTACYSHPAGTLIEADIANQKSFTIVDGFTGYDMVPGEIATYPDSVNGHVVFCGTFLSLIPFALKYGLVNAGELIFDIEDKKIINVRGDHAELVQDFKNHFAHHAGNNRIDEFGIGTNLGVTKLYGTNSVFEERHQGLHLGLGGRIHGSLHLDLLFADGTLSCDNKTIYENGQYLPDIITSFTS